jgi:CubicO group peptidase (beta-lactamase class C family)
MVGCQHETIEDSSISGPEQENTRMPGTRTSGFSRSRLARMHAMMADPVATGKVPGLVTLISRRGRVHVATHGVQALDSGTPMRRDTIFRISSMTKPIAAAAAMILVEECRLRLDDPVDLLLPELAGRRVLRRLDGPLDETVPASRPISLRDLLTLRMGLGHLLAPESVRYPIRKAMDAQQLLQGPPRPQDPPEPDEWIMRVGKLPLMHHPGEAWMYDLGMDVLGVLIARAAGRPLEAFMRERIFEPLDMKDTGFSVPADKQARLADSYYNDPDSGALAVYDEAAGGQWSRPPAFASAAAGLVSTVDDMFAFGRMMLHKGRHGRRRILSRPSVELMTSGQLTDGQKAGAEILLGVNRDWGFGMAVVTRRDHLWATPGRYGWNGGLGTSWAVDPVEDLQAVLMTQRALNSPVFAELCHDFWTCVYQAVVD